MPVLLLTKSRTGIPDSGIPSDWSVLTLDVNSQGLLRQTGQKCNIAVPHHVSLSHTHEFDFILSINTLKDVPCVDSVRREQKECLYSSSYVSSLSYQHKLANNSKVNCICQFKLLSCTGDHYSKTLKQLSLPACVCFYAYNSFKFPALCLCLCFILALYV